MTNGKTLPPEKVRITSVGPQTCLPKLREGE